MNPVDVVERFFGEVWNGRDLAVLDEIVHENCVTHQVRSAPEPISSVARGPAALREHIQAWLRAFPGMQVTTDHRSVCANEVISWVTMRGTHRGPWQGIAPTGREITIRTIAQHRVEAGRIVEDWVIVETLGVFQQLGVVPPTQELLQRHEIKQGIKE
jgi:predicted ester cyclase